MIMTMQGTAARTGDLMYSITNYHNVRAADLDYSQLGEYYLRYIHAKIGNTLIKVKSTEDSYYYRIKHKNKSLSEIKDISIPDLIRYGELAFMKFRYLNLELMLLSAGE